MSNRMWDNTVEHAKTCVLSGMLYVYYSDDAQSTGAVFNHIYELQGIISNGQFLSLESISHDQKVKTFGFSFSVLAFLVLNGRNLLIHHKFLKTEIIFLSECNGTIASIYCHL